MLTVIRKTMHREAVSISTSPGAFSPSSLCSSFAETKDLDNAPHQLRRVFKTRNTHGSNHAGRSVRGGEKSVMKTVNRLWPRDWASEIKRPDHRALHPRSARRSTGRRRCQSAAEADWQIHVGSPYCRIPQRRGKRLALRSGPRYTYRRQALLTATAPHAPEGP